MAVTDTILGFIADIGLNAAKGRYRRFPLQRPERRIAHVH